MLTGVDENSLDGFSGLSAETRLCRLPGSAILPAMTSLTTYSLVELSEKLKNPSHVETIRQAIAEIEALERRVAKLTKQLEELGETPDPGEWS